MTIEDTVIRVLNENQETRNSDKKLYLEVIKLMGLEFSEENIEKLPSFETVRRRRQEQNEAGKFLPTDPEVLVIRRLYRLCVGEILVDEGYPQQIIVAVCKRCPRKKTDKCNLFGGVPAGAGF